MVSSGDLSVLHENDPLAGQSLKIPPFTTKESNPIPLRRSGTILAAFHHHAVSITTTTLSHTHPPIPRMHCLAPSSDHPCRRRKKLGLLCCGPLRRSASRRLCESCNQISLAREWCRLTCYSALQNPLRYIPTLWVAALALSLYFVTSILLTIQFWRHGRGKWFLCLIIGGYCEAFGLLMRIPFRSNPHSTGIYIIEYLFVVLSPCAFLAGDYIVFGRLVQMLDGQRHVPIRANRIMRFFVASDVTTFLIQAAGGGLSTAQNASSQKTGGDIFLAGIALQMVSFAFFTGLYLWFGFRCYTRDKYVWNAPGWKPLYWALGWTCIGFLIRSVYRTIELSQGYTGYLNTHEPWFYIFDTVSPTATAIFYWAKRF